MWMHLWAKGGQSPSRATPVEAITSQPDQRADPLFAKTLHTAYVLEKTADEAVVQIWEEDEVRNLIYY